MVNLICALFAISVTWHPAVSHKPVLRTDLTQIYDKFGDEVDLPYFDGLIKLICEIREFGNDPCPMVHLIDPDGKTLMEKDCDQQLITFEIRIDEKIKFGQYRCKHENVVSEESFDFNFRLCGHTESECINTEVSWDIQLKCYKTYCIVTAEGVQPCAKLNESPINATCPHRENGTVYCPYNLTSLCDMHAVDNTKYKSYEGACPNELYTPQILTIDRVIYGATVKLQGYLSIDCSKSMYYAREKNIQTICDLKSDTAKVNIRERFDHCIYVGDIFPAKPLRYEYGFHTYKIRCNVTQNHTELIGRMDQYAVSARFNVTVDIKPPSDEDDPNGNLTLVCQINPSLPAGNWKVDYHWQVGTRALRNAGPQIVVSKEGLYECYGEVSYVTCTPRMKPLWFFLENDGILIEQWRFSTMTSVTNSTTAVQSIESSRIRTTPPVNSPNSTSSVVEEAITTTPKVPKARTDHKDTFSGVCSMKLVERNQHLSTLIGVFAIILNKIK